VANTFEVLAREWYEKHLPGWAPSYSTLLLRLFERGLSLDRLSTGRAEGDPSADLRGALPAAIGEHLAAVTKPEEVGVLLRVLDGYDGSPVVAAALRLAAILFVTTASSLRQRTVPRWCPHR
jgi:hypothetical protein